jgi:hypothetical protein
MPAKENREIIRTALGLGAGLITRVTGPRGGLRHYEVDDAKLTSVTTIISETVRKPGLERWREGLIRKGISPNQESKQAAAMGTALHATIERLLCGEDVEVPEELLPAIKGFERWRSEYPLRHAASEVAVYNTTRGYAGTIDAIFEDGYDLVLVDFKSGSRVYGEACIQLSMYMAGLRSMGYDGKLAGKVVLFQKTEGVFDGDVEVADIDEHDWDQAWQGMLDLHLAMALPIETVAV